MTKTTEKKHTIDASGRAPGRVATEVAVLLMGKNRTDFTRNAIPDIEVEVENAGKMRLDQKKLTDKVYHNYSGYPGGLKTESMERVLERKGAKEILRRAVNGMLPKNKLRARMLKNLTIKD